jgi:zinc transport system ATP-binding protein
MDEKAPPLIEPLIELKNSGLKVRDRWLVRGVNLHVNRGEIVTLIGPNGSGKSTTARMALGIKKPSEGNAAKIANLRVGYVPQKLAIDWTLPITVSRFMQLTTKLKKDEIISALKMVSAEHLLNADLQPLSGGEFQRVQLARAIARNPDLLVLDEPVQGVDFNGEIALYQLIEKLRDQLNCGILMISHDLHLVMASTDRVICLNGHVCCEGSPKTVAESNEYQSLFGTHAAATLAIYHHQHDHKHLPDGRVQHSDGSITDHCNHDNHDHNNHEDASTNINYEHRADHEMGEA